MVDEIDRLKFSNNVKKYLKLAYFYAKRNANIPLFYDISSSEFLDRYINNLKMVNGIIVVNPNELSSGVSDLDNFISDMYYVGKNKGDYIKKDDKYYSSKNGSYKCLCRGFTYVLERVLFILGDDNLEEIICTIFHELSHITEGKYCFNINNDMPLSIEFKRMCCEGRAVSSENVISINRKNKRYECIIDRHDIVVVQSKTNYSLYSILYRLLQIIYGNEDLDRLCCNNTSDIEWFNYLDNGEIDYTVYYNIINILSVYNGYGRYLESSSVKDSFKNIFEIASFAIEFNKLSGLNSKYVESMNIFLNNIINDVKINVYDESHKYIKER